MKNVTRAPVLGAIYLAIFGISPLALASNVVFTHEPLESIEVKNDTLFPEGITYNPRSDRFILGSFRQGAIFDVDKNGNTQKIIEDERLHSVLAVRIDTVRNKLLVLTSDLGASIKTSPKAVKHYAALATYDLSSGKPLQFVDLSKILPDSEHLVNGMTLDNDGHAYITDSFAAAIYKVDNKGVASLFLQNDAFKGKGINLNGIIYHPNGYLMTVKKSNGALYKIPLNQPENFSVVKSDDQYIGADGLILAKNNEVIIIANRALGHNTDAAFSVHSNDEWQTMKTTGQYPFGNVYPTTGVIKNGALYVVYTKLNRLVSAPPSEKQNLRQNPVIEYIGSVKPD